jgi:L-ascorbate metabolism protein UlaG (beta-lactamase superfamily)
MLIQVRQPEVVQIQISRVDAMKLTYFGHSAFQLETEKATLLVDPFISGNPLAEGTVSVGSLHAEVILLTHAHGDHWGDTVEIATRDNALVVGAFEITQYITSRHGHTHVQPMNTGGSWTFDWGSITYTDARHSSSFPDGTYGGCCNGIIIRADGRTVYDAGDTAPFAEMEWIGEEEKLDLALLPIGDCFTMGPDASIRCVKMLKAKRVLPIHYNTFPLVEVSQEALKAWKQAVSDAGSEPVVLGAGEILEF